MSAGCNHIGGSYELVGGHLATGADGDDRHGLRDSRSMEQDTWLSGFVSGATVGLDGIDADPAGTVL